MIFSTILALFFGEIGYVEPWNEPTKTHPTEEVSLSPIGQFAEKAILFYKSSITQICGARSHFRPTSSGYMLEAIRSHGFIKGYIMGCDRLLRENSDPWVYRMVPDEDLQA